MTDMTSYCGCCLRKLPSKSYTSCPFCKTSYSYKIKHDGHSVYISCHGRLPSSCPVCKVANLTSSEIRVV